MDSKKVSIIGLVSIGILFAVGLGGGLFRDDDSVDENDQAARREASQEQSGWTGTIKSGLSGLGLIDGIDVQRFRKIIPPPGVTSNCTGKMSGSQYLVTLGAGCDLTADIKKDGDEQELKLVVTKGCGKARDFARLKRITTAMKVSPHIKPGIVAGTQGGSIPDESSDTWPGLIISYKLAEDKEVEMDKPSWVCGDEPFTLIILPKGGTLTLECSKCSGSKKLEVQFGD
jgi:hypothetical protein